MSLSASDLQDLQRALADRLYVQISGWHLYLGDADLASALAIECSARVNQGAEVAARQALDAVKVPLAGGCLLYTSPSPRDRTRSRMPSSA